MAVAVWAREALHWGPVSVHGLRQRRGAKRSTVQVRRGVTRSAAAARQPGAEMNETYGMSASEVTSHDNPV